MMELSGWALLEYAHRRNKGIVMSDQSGYTRIPNDIIEAMPYLGNAELRVLLAIARKTVGYQKVSDRISVSQIEGLTGLTSRNAQKALAALLDKGYISREQVGKQSYSYSLQTISPRDTVENHIPSDPISPRDTEPYPLGTRIDPKPYPLGITQKKDLKEKRNSAGAKSAERKPREKKDTTPEPIVIALADVCKIDRAVASYEQRQQLYQSAGILYRAGRKAGQSEEQIAEAIKYVAGWYRNHDWRGQKGQAPTPKQMRDVWRQAIDVRKSNAPPQPTRIERPADARPAQETASAMMNALARRNGKHDATP